MTGHTGSGPEITYFGLQAYLGTTKHMGGFQSSAELIEACHVDGDTYVLDVGCGVGATTCYLAKTYGCKAVGVDLREGMVARAHERAQVEGVAGDVEFRVADAQDLPFEDAIFDVVLCESVATFVEDKRRVMSELARVTVPGGYVGLNEEVWLKTPPSEMVAYARKAWGIVPELLRVEDWEAMLRDGGLRDVSTVVNRIDVRRESTQLKRYRWGDMWRMFSRTLSLYFKSAAFRAYMRKRRNAPKKLFQYLGYGVFVGKK